MVQQIIPEALPDAPVVAVEECTFSFCVGMIDVEQVVGQFPPLNMGLISVW
jgi:hypothetical protein